MKAKMKLHKLLSILLALVMVVGMLPAMSLTAYATVTTHSVYVYDKDTGKKYAFDYYDETYYYTVGNDRTGTLEENPDWNVHFDRRNAVLELRNYNGGRIEARYTNWAYEENYLKIKLIGNNTITNSSNYPGLLSNQEYLDITTDENVNGTLTITNTNYYVGIKAEDLVIGNLADVTVNVPMLPDDNCACAIGIYLDGEFALVGDSASCTVNITNESNAEDYAYGIQADSIKLSTGGNLYVDVSQAGTYSYGIVSKSLNDTNRHINSATIKYKKDSNGRGSALLPENLFDIFATSSSYAVNINDDKGIATYRYGAPVRTVTVTNGTCDASGKSTGEFFAGDTVHVTANEAPDGYQITGWSSSDVTVPAISVLTTSFPMPDKDISVSVEYAPRPHTVTFQTWAISDPPPKQIVNYGDTADKPNNPESDYYTFAGWYKDDEYTIPFDFKNTPITEDITLYAKWLDGTIHTVTFANGNNAPSTTSELPEAQLVANGNLAAKPEPDPTAEGWMFAGWMKGPTGWDGYFDFATETITKDITLYADWAEPYYVTFDANGGTGTMDSVAVIPGYDCTIPECGFTAPEGKQFKGWAFDPNSTEVVQFKSFAVTGGDKTLYAIWSDVHNHSWATEYSKDANYHWVDCTAAGCDIIANSDKVGYDAHHYDQEIATDEYKAADGNCTAPATYYKSCICGAKGTETFEYGGPVHTFGAWIDEVPATCTTEGTMGHKDCTVCNKHFDTDGYEIDDLTIPVDPDNHAGTLSGWQTDSDNHWKEYSCCHVKAEEGKHVFGSDNICDTCLYVKPEIKSVTVSPATAEVTKGNTQQFTATVDKTGEIADTVTWSVNSTKSTISDTGLLTVGADETAATLTVTATSTADTTKSGTATVTVNEVPVTPAINKVTVSPATAEVTKGNTQQFTATVDKTGDIAETVTWSVTGATSTNTSISDTGLLTVGSDETATTLTVTATSTADTTKRGTATVTVNYYTVSFDSNGGTGTMADVTGVSGEYTLPANDFTAPDGKHFKCWSVDGVEKAVGDTINVTANTTVIAQWTTILDKPTNLVWDGTTAKWDAVTGANKYRVILYASTSGYGGSTIFNDDLEANSKDFSEYMLPGMYYYFDVAAYNSANLNNTFSGFNSSAKKQMPGSIGTVTGFAWSGNTISWTAVEGATGYDVWVMKNGVQKDSVRNVSGTSLDLTSDFESGGEGTYYVSVSAYKLERGNYLAEGNSPAKIIGATPVISAAVGNVTVNGTVGTAITETQVAVDLTNDTFESNLSGNWITNLPAGLSQSVSYGGTTRAIITISGTPTAASTEQIAITIPEDQLIVNTEDLTVTANADAKFNISAAETYTVSGTATSFGSDTDNVILQLIAEGYSEADYEVFVKGNTANYTIEGVAPGTYTMKVMKNNHVTREYTVTVSTENVTQDVKIHLKGDIDGNGTVTTMDYMRVNSHAKGITLLTDYALKCADVVGTDGKVTTMDAMRVNAHARGTAKLW